MDFLDPRKKRRFHYRLIAGYFLMAIAIGLGAVILVYAAYGYGIDTKTGQIVQNGLLFVDSKPGGADIYINGKTINSTTSARLVLPAGSYSLELKRSGYRSWQRSFVLDEHTVSRFVYPFLIPTKPQVTSLKTYSALPRLTTESPDRHWLLVQRPASTTSSIIFDQYDTTNLTHPAEELVLPASLLINPDSGDSLTEVEWSTDNNHLLLKHSYDGGDEFIILDRVDPASSINVNRLLNINPTQVALRNKRIAQLYIYDQAKKTLQMADVGKADVDTPLLHHVLAFKAYGPNLISYISDADMPPGQVQARIWDNHKTYKLSTVAAGQNYLIDAAQFQGHWYYVAGSDQAERVYLYKDPLTQVRDPSLAKAISFLSFHLPGANKVSFSTNARFIGIEGGKQFAVYDIETKDSYQYQMSPPLAGDMHWMDGHRWIGASAGSVFVVDYDNTNGQLISPTLDPRGGYFSRSFNQLLVLTASPSETGSIELQAVDMRAGTDLPKTAL